MEKIYIAFAGGDGNGEELLAEIEEGMPDNTEVVHYKKKLEAFESYDVSKFISEELPSANYIIVIVSDKYLFPTKYGAQHHCWVEATCIANGVMNQYRDGPVVFPVIHKSLEFNYNVEDIDSLKNYVISEIEGYQKNKNNSNLTKLIREWVLGVPNFIDCLEKSSLGVNITDNIKQDLDFLFKQVDAQIYQKSGLDQFEVPRCFNNNHNALYRGDIGLVPKRVPSDLLDKEVINTVLKQVAGKKTFSLIDGKTSIGKTSLLEHCAKEWSNQGKSVYFIDVTRDDFEAFLSDSNVLDTFSDNKLVVVIAGLNFDNNEQRNLFEKMLLLVKENKAHLVISSRRNAEKETLEEEVSTLISTMFEIGQEQSDRYKYHLFASLIKPEEATKQYKENHRSEPSAEEELNKLLESNAPHSEIMALLRYNMSNNDLLDRILKNGREMYGEKELEFDLAVAIIYFFTKNGDKLFYGDSFSMYDPVLVDLANCGFILKQEHYFTSSGSDYDSSIIFKKLGKGYKDVFVEIIKKFRKINPLIKYLPKEKLDADIRESLVSVIWKNFEQVLRKSNIYDLRDLFNLIKEEGGKDEEARLNQLYNFFKVLTIENPSAFYSYKNLYKEIKNSFLYNKWEFNECDLGLSDDYPDKHYFLDKHWTLNLDGVIEDLQPQSPKRNVALFHLVVKAHVSNAFLDEKKLGKEDNYSDYILFMHKLKIDALTNNTKSCIQRQINYYISHIENISYIERQALLRLLLIYHFYTGAPSLTPKDNQSDIFSVNDIYPHILKKHKFDARGFESLTRIMHFKGLVNKESFDIPGLMKADIKNDGVIFELLFEYRFIDEEEFDQVFSYIKKRFWGDYPQVFFKLFKYYYSDKKYKNKFLTDFGFRSVIEWAITYVIKYIKKTNKPEELCKFDPRTAVGSFYRCKEELVQYCIDTKNHTLLQKIFNIYAYFNTARQIVTDRIGEYEGDEKSRFARDIKNGEFQSESEEKLKKYYLILNESNTSDIYKMLYKEHKLYARYENLVYYRNDFEDNSGEANVLEFFYPHEEERYRWFRETALHIRRILVNYYLNNKENNYHQNIIANFLKRDDPILYQKNIIELYKQGEVSSNISWIKDKNKSDLFNYYFEMGMCNEAEEAKSNLKGDFLRWAGERGECCSGVFHITVAKTLEKIDPEKYRKEIVSSYEAGKHRKEQEQEQEQEQSFFNLACYYDSYGTKDDFVGAVNNIFNSRVLEISNYDRVTEAVELSRKANIYETIPTCLKIFATTRNLLFKCYSLIDEGDSYLVPYEVRNFLEKQDVVNFGGIKELIKVLRKSGLTKDECKNIIPDYSKLEDSENVFVEKARRGEKSEYEIIAKLKHKEVVLRDNVDALQEILREDYDTWYFAPSIMEREKVILRSIYASIIYDDINKENLIAEVLEKQAVICEESIGFLKKLLDDNVEQVFNPQVVGAIRKSLFEFLCNNIRSEQYQTYISNLFRENNSKFLKYRKTVALCLSKNGLKHKISSVLGTSGKKSITKKISSYLRKKSKKRLS